MDAETSKNNAYKNKIKSKIFCPWDEMKRLKDRFVIAKIKTMVETIPPRDWARKRSKNAKQRTNRSIRLGFKREKARQNTGTRYKEDA